MRGSGVSARHYRHVVMLSKDDPVRAEVYIKYLMGRRIIDWKDGEELLGYLKRGLLRQAFTVYNFLERKMEVSV